MKKLNFLSIRSGYTPDLTTRQSRSVSVSYASRLRVLATLLLCLTIGVGRSFGVEIYNEDFGSNTTSKTKAFSSSTDFSEATTWSIMTDGGWNQGRNASSPSDYSGASGNAYAQKSSAGDLILVFGDLTDYTDVVLSFGYRNGASTKGARTFAAYVSGDGGDTWTEIECNKSRKTQTWEKITYEVPAAKLTDFAVKFSNTSSNQSAVDDVILTGTAAGPACADPSAPGNSSVSWTGVTISTSSAAANYDIYYSTSSTTPTTEDPTATITSGNSKAITGLSYGTTYYYWMRQNCGSSTSSWVAGSPTSFTTTVPAPTGVSAVSITMTGATISITDASNVNNYDVYCSESSTAPVAGTTPSASGTSKSIAVTGLTTGRTYYYWARAKGPNAQSTWYGGSTFTTVSLSSISVSTAPTTTKYLVGDNFDPTGLVITRTYSNSTSDTYSYAGHTAEFSFSPATNAALTAENTSVTITYGGQTTSQAINVYTVTVNKVNMSGTAIADANVSASCSGRTLSQSVGATDYVFDSYVVTAGGVTISTNTITSTPTGNVTINAKFHDPITVTWKVNDAPYTTGGPTGSVKYGTAWSSLKLPTDPTPPCEDVFVGWTTDDIGTTGLDKDDDDDATRIAALNLMTSSNKSGKSTTITNNVTFYAVFADYTTD